MIIKRLSKSLQTTRGSEETLAADETSKRVLIICGTHGDETHAIKTCWNLYKALDQGNIEISRKLNITFAFLANENAVKFNDRCYQELDPETSNLNRAFVEDSESFEEIVTKVKDLIIPEIAIRPSYDVVLDVHNSPTCANTVLVDYGPRSDAQYRCAIEHNLHPMLRPSQNFGTIKRFCNEKGIATYTVEMSPMFMEYSNNLPAEDMEYLSRVILAGCELSDEYNQNSKSVKAVAPARYLTKELYNFLPKAIIQWDRKKPYGEYFKGERICTLIDIDSEEEAIVTAPEDLTIQCINCTDVAFEGYTLLEYSPIDMPVKAEN